MGIREKMLAAGRFVDPEMGFHRLVRVGWVILSTPKDIFPFDGRGFGMGHV